MINCENHLKIILRVVEGDWNHPVTPYIFIYSNKNLIEITKRKTPKILLILLLSILWTVFAPILAINVVIGIKIKKAGIFKNPKLKGRFVLKYVPVIKKPIAPNNAIKNPIAAALPIALLIE